MSIATGLTADDYLSGDFDRDTELLHGEVIVNDPRLEHQRLVGRIFYALETWARARDGRGEVGFGGNWVFGPDTVLKPDLWWIRSERVTELGSARHDTVPDLAVEVRSAGTWRYDIGSKRALYERGGVRELWLVDPPGSVVIVNRRSAPLAAGFDVTLEVALGQVLTSPLLPSFELAVNELLAA
jgi:Uma2 family endonuclease